MFIGASEAYAYFDDWSIGTGPSTTNSADEKAALWSEATHALVRQLRETSSEVVILQPTPKAVADPTVCSIFDWRTRPQPCDLERSRLDALRETESIAAVDRIAADADGATVIETFDALCPSDPCRSVVGGVYAYRDAGHISVAAAQQLTPLFEEAIARATS